MANKRPTGKRIDEPTGTETVGHEWDGIEELDTPMPRWWLWTFYLTIVWGVVYVVLYPAWPLIEKGTEGVLGWTSRGQLAGLGRLEEQLDQQALDRRPVVADPLGSLLHHAPGHEQLNRTHLSSPPRQSRTASVDRTPWRAPDARIEPGAKRARPRAS